jgi:hypothetical protein
MIPFPGGDKPYCKSHNLYEVNLSPAIILATILDALQATFPDPKGFKNLKGLAVKRNAPFLRNSHHHANIPHPGLHHGLQYERFLTVPICYIHIHYSA